MKTEVSFSATFADPLAGDDAKAKSLAEFFIEKLVENGYQCSKAEDLDYAFAFRCIVDDRNFYLIVGLVDDEDREWLLSTNSDLGRIKRLFGGTDVEQHKALTQVLHSIMEPESRISNVRWYTAEDWNNRPDESWSDTP